ncbi:hypothetical protein LXL04_034329 [Taraxacum kok-saghyz]
MERQIKVDSVGFSGWSTQEWWSFLLSDDTETSLRDYVKKFGFPLCEKDEAVLAKLIIAFELPPHGHRFPSHRLRHDWGNKFLQSLGGKWYMHSAEDGNPLLHYKGEILIRNCNKTALALYLTTARNEDKFNQILEAIKA